MSESANHLSADGNGRRPGRQRGEGKGVILYHDLSSGGVDYIRRNPAHVTGDRKGDNICAAGGEIRFICSAIARVVFSVRDRRRFASCDFHNETFAE